MRKVVLARAGVDTEFSSVALCEWADVMLVIGSSILIESLVQHKPVLYLKYLHENITQHEELGACWTIHNEAELKDALLSLQENIMNLPYTDENIDSSSRRLFMVDQVKGTFWGITKTSV